MTDRKVRVVIADDHPFIRAGIRHFLGEATDIQVVGEAINGLEAVELVINLSPDVLILDLQMPLMDGIQVIEVLHQNENTVHIIILSGMDDLNVVSEVILMGVRGYYVKEDAPKLLLEGVRKAMTSDQIEISPCLIQKGFIFL